MKFPVLTILLIFILILAYYIKKSNSKIKENDENFWAKEHEANFTRKKDLSDIHFIHVPEEITQIEEDCTSTDAMELYKQLITYKTQGKKSADFNGITNTDLKLKYGAGNLALLSEYDKNYSDLIMILDRLSAVLTEEGKMKSAETILEFATDSGTDICSSYTRLADIYIQTGKRNNIHLLIKKADTKQSFRTPAIIRALNEKLDNTDPLKNI